MGTNLRHDDLGTRSDSGDSPAPPPPPPPTPPPPPPPTPPSPGTVFELEDEPLIDSADLESSGLETDGLANGAIEAGEDDVAEGSGGPAPDAKVRDRIVVLGRRKAGKTIFMARLYEQLWQSEGEMHMRTVSGNDHLYFMRNIKELREGSWPAATGGSTYAAIEVDYARRKHLMVLLDYAGEVFRRAFVEGIVDESSEELLDHVDRAAAVMLLIDPSVAVEGNVEDFADDDYGMAAAIRRIRDWPGGESVPVAIVLTKIDRFKRRLEDSGGLVPFVERYYRPLLRQIGKVRVFGASAVRQSVDGLGKARPAMTKRPVGLVEPLKYCLKRLTLVAEQSEQHVREMEAIRRRAAFEQQEAQAQQRQQMILTAFWIAVPILLVLAAAITLILVF